MASKEHIEETINHLFRHESGKMVSVLVKIFGSENFEMAEDVVQEALLSALETWKYRGMPDNPRAWLYRVAKNKAIDIIRKNKHSNLIDFSDPERQLLTSEYSLAHTMNNYWQENQIEDDFLGMMYACCHPKISAENQVTFILKSLCGFSTREVAKSFLTSEDTVSKRLYRTKEYFRKNKLKPKIPSEDEINSRTAAVLSAIYLLFNEGYSATDAKEHIREDLISHAMYLCNQLLRNERTNLPEVNALMALMCFHTARTPSRLSNDGHLINLKDQDRTLWSKELIAAGRAYLYTAGQGDTYSIYHLEAAISHEHCMAESYDKTNWNAILNCYDALFNISFDPVIAMNRCLVIMELSGPEVALSEMRELRTEKVLQDYYLYYASLGEIYSRLKNNAETIANFTKALKLTKSKHEVAFFKSRIEHLRK